MNRASSTWTTAKPSRAITASNLQKALVLPLKMWYNQRYPKFSEDEAMTILWDWNGAALSDVPLVVKINNEVFARHGYRLTSEEEYRRIFRFPVKDYYTDIGVTDEDFPLVAKEWNEGYVANFHLAPFAPDSGGGGSSLPRRRLPSGDYLRQSGGSAARAGCQVSRAGRHVRRHSGAG